MNHEETGHDLRCRCARCCGFFPQVGTDLVAKAAPIRSRLRHRWLTYVGRLRIRLREWLGVNELESSLGEQAVDISQLRQDLNAAEEATKNLFEFDDKRTKLTEANVHETVRQLRVTQDALAKHDQLLRAWKTVPALNKAAQVAWRAQQKLEKKRVASDVIGHVGTNGDEPAVIDAAEPVPTT